MTDVAAVPTRVAWKVRTMVNNVRDRRAKLYASIDKPLSNEVRSESIDVEGWAFSTKYLPMRGEILFHAGRTAVSMQDRARLVLPIHFDVSRPDVEQGFGYAQRERMHGFHASVRWSQLGDDCDAVRVSVKIEDRYHCLSFGPIFVFRNQQPSSRDRGNYKGVWENVVDTHAAAMVAVAGFGDYESYMESGRSSANTMKDRLSITTDDVVLEIGCGTGRIGAALAPLSKKWIGADISRPMLDHARTNLADLPNVELRELTTCSLDGVANDSVDKLYCSAVFMHLDEWDRFRYVKEAYRVLRSGGLAYFDNYDLESEPGWELFEKHAALDPMERPPNISKSSTAAELLTYMKRAGFADVRSAQSGLFVEVIGRKN